MSKEINNIGDSFSIVRVKAKYNFITHKIIFNDLFWLLLICAIFRLIYYNGIIDTYEKFPDSRTYLNYNSNILLGEVDILRTPVYPYFIKFIKMFSNENYISNIILVQIVISFLSIIVFYNAAKIALKNRTIIWLTTAIYGTMPLIMNFDKCILTESLSISFSVLFLYFIVSYLDKPTISKAVLYTLYIFILIMLRPSFIAVFLVISLFWMLRLIYCKIERKMCLFGLAATFFTGLLIAGYCHLNYINNGLNSLTVASNINQIDNVINSEIYMDGDDPAISEAIRSNLGEQKRIWNVSVNRLLAQNYPQERISRFIKNCIINNPSAYARDVFNKIEVLKDKAMLIHYAEYKGEPSGYLSMDISEKMAIPFIGIYILLVFNLIYMIIVRVRSKEFPWLKFIVWLIIMAQFTTAVVGAQAEYQRLFVVALPYIVILFGSCVDDILKMVYRKRNLEVIN